MYVTATCMRMNMKNTLRFWETMKNMDIERSDFAFMSIHSNFAYAIGGTRESKYTTSRVSMYSISDNSWTQVVRGLKIIFYLHKNTFHIYVFTGWFAHKSSNDLQCSFG